MASRDRPNILLITSDQHRGDCYGFEGRAVRTPHLDWLAGAGTRFSACITPNVVCQPARASMLTGLLPLTHGVHDNGIDLDEDAARCGFAGQLGGAGYRTAFIGKAHFSTYHTFTPSGRPENVASAHRFGDDWLGPYMGFDHVELMLIGHNWWLPERPPGGLHYERWYHRGGRGDALDDLYRQRLGPDTEAAQTHCSGLPTVFHNSTWTADRTIDYLRSAAHADAPFCLWASFPDPHHPFDAPAPWSHLHDPAAVDLPPHRRRDLDRRPWWHRAALENTPGVTGEMRSVREQYSRISPQTDAQLRDLIANYYGMIALIDHNVGRIVEALADCGLAENTLVVFTSDHGEWLGDHGLMLKGPMFYEGLLRVGLIVRGPGVPAGRTIADPVSTLDLAATFGDVTGVPGAADAVAGHGRSLRPVWEGRERRAFARSEWKLGPQRCGVALDLRCVRTAAAKLTVERLSGAGELYDLRDDPHECLNRFDDPACRGLRADLEAMIASRPDDERDPLPQPIGAA